MKTIAQIIALHGGLQALKERYIRIENPPFMRLVLECVGQGPEGLPLISVAHYGEMNGDAMRDPEIVFEADPDNAPDHWLPMSFLNDYVGVYQEAVFQRDGRWLRNPQLVRELRSFARIWDQNVRDQGFVKAYLSGRQPSLRTQPSTTNH